MLILFSVNIYFDFFVILKFKLWSGSHWEQIFREFFNSYLLFFSRLVLSSLPHFIVFTHFLPREIFFIEKSYREKYLFKNYSILLRRFFLCFIYFFFSIKILNNEWRVNRKGDDVINFSLSWIVTENDVFAYFIPILNSNRERKFDVTGHVISLIQAQHIRWLQTKKGKVTLQKQKKAFCPSFGVISL